MIDRVQCIGSIFTCLGERGFTGERGSTGLPGNQGAKGETGAQGMYYYFITLSQTTYIIIASLGC